MPPHRPVAADRDPARIAERFGAGTREPDPATVALWRAAWSFARSDELAPLRAWWRNQLEGARLLPGPVDPLRLAMAQGDRERLSLILVMAEQYEAHLGRQASGRRRPMET
jgi:hypothetical protein